MEILFLLVGLVFVAFGVAVVLSEASARHGAWAQQGEVIGFSSGKGGGSGAPSYHPVVEYVGPDGRKRYLESLVGSSSPFGAVGDAVTVLVQPEDPEKAVLKSSLTYGVGAAFGLMGLASCIAFFAVFRATPFSLVSAAGVVTWAAYQFRRSTGAKPMNLEIWRKFKDEAFRPKVFTDATKAEISWADPEAVRAAMAKQQKVNRFVLPILLLAGVGLLFLGATRSRTRSARILPPTVEAMPSAFSTTLIVRAMPGSTVAAGTRRCLSSSGASARCFACSRSGAQADGGNLVS